MRSAKGAIRNTCARWTYGSSGCASACAMPARSGCCAQSTARATCSTCPEQCGKKAAPRRAERPPLLSECHRERARDGRAHVVSVDLYAIGARLLELFVLAAEDVAHLDLKLG